MKSKVLSVPLQHRHSSVEACPKMPVLRLFAELCYFNVYPSFITHWPLLWQDPSFWLTCSQRWRGQSNIYLVYHVFPYFKGNMCLVWSMHFNWIWIEHENMKCISSRDQAQHSCLSTGMWMEIRAFDNDITLRCTRRLISSPLLSHHHNQELVLSGGASNTKVKTSSLCKNNFVLLLKRQLRTSYQFFSFLCYAALLWVDMRNKEVLKGELWKLEKIIDL